MRFILISIIKFVWSKLCSYVLRSCTGEFLDTLFDETLESFAKSTKTTVDDRLVQKWKEQRKKVS